MKGKVTLLFLALVLLLSLCLVAVTSVAADDGDNGNVAHSINSSSQFECNLGYPFGISGGVIKVTMKMLDNDTVTDFINSFYKHGVIIDSWQRQEVIEAEIVEIDGKPAVWTLNKTVDGGTMFPYYPCPPFPAAGKYWVALIVDGDNPCSGEHYILLVAGLYSSLNPINEP